MKLKTLQKNSIGNVETILRQYDKENELFWEKLRQNTIQSSFIKAASTIPAYQNFLKKNGLNRYKIDSTNLETIPPINKKNYFKYYSIENFFQQHKGLSQPLVTTSTSGSTGEPTYFFRSEELDWQYSVLASYFLSNGPKGSTLLVNCFGMGVWIGGLITYEAFRLAGLRGSPITIIAPGVNKKEIFHTLRNLAPNFDNIIISGYPPFVKDIIDEAINEKINLKKLKIRFLFAAESFTENFRDYLCEKVGIVSPINDTLNIYGSAELGAMAFETPFAIFVRRMVLRYPNVYKKLFIESKLPTIAQYNPSFVAFEESNGEIFISAPNTVPFVKYQIGDNGGVYSLSQINSAFKEEGINLVEEAKKIHVRINHLPFVYVYERNDFSISLYGLQIYPQSIKKSLEKNNLSKFVTGKFSMLTKFNKKHDQYLEINIEIKPKIKQNSRLKSSIEREILSQLLLENSEFRELYNSLKERCRPIVNLWNYNDPNYFPTGKKQVWIKK